MIDRRCHTTGRIAPGVIALAIAFGTAGPAGPVAVAQEPGPAEGRESAKVRDSAGLFGADAIARAQRTLEPVARRSGASILIETIDSLEGQPAGQVAVNMARRSGIRGVFIMAARKEHKLEVLGSGRFRQLLDEANQRAIVEAFADGFRRKDYNDGLERGVAALVRVLEAARPAPGDKPRPPVPEARSGSFDAGDREPKGVRTAGDSPLVERNRVRLTLEGARTIIDGAEAKARSMGWKMNIAVVDDGGHLIAFERMEGARPASAYTAITKATTAATMRMPSGPFPPGTTHPDPLLNISLQNAASASGGKVTTLYGGVPVIVNGQVIGAAGAGGGSGEQDAEAVRAGIRTFNEQLSRPAGTPSDDPTKPDRSVDHAPENRGRDNP